MLTCQVEPLDRLLRDGLEDLAIAHWEEVERNLPYAPAWSHYRALEKAAGYLVIAARANRILVGYNSFFLNRHSHALNTTIATGDCLYLAPEERRGWAAVRFLKDCEPLLRERGATRLSYGTPFHMKHGALGRVLERLGYTAEETLYGKGL